MSSHFFLTYASPVVNVMYKILGKHISNFIVRHSAGSIFTAGESLKDLKKDMDRFERKNIFAVANYVVEGINEMIPK